MKYSEEFKQEVIQYIKDNPTLSRRSVSKKFKVSSPIIHCWLDPEFKEQYNKKNARRNKDRYTSDPKFREKIKNDHKQRMLDPEYRNRFNKMHAKWQRHKNATDIKWRLKRNAYHNKYQKYKYITDPVYREKCKIQAKKYRAKKFEVNEYYTKADETYTMKLFNHQCAKCGSKEELCIDHWMPLSKGYALSRENAVVLCRSCNSSKGGKLPEDHFPAGFIELIESKLFN